MPEADGVISVVLCAYDAERTIGETISSILAQTYGTFELVVVDDGSTDGTAGVVGGFTDPRIRLVRLPENQGLIAALNRGLDEARGDFVARMDADDIAMPSWLAEELEFLRSHPEVGIVGCQLELFGDSSGLQEYPTDPRAVRLRMLYTSPFPNNAVLIRRSIIEEHGLRFDSGYPHAEDFKFWSELLKYTEGANLDRPLVRYRAHSGQVSVMHRATQRRSRNRVRAEVVQDLWPGVVADAAAFLEPDFAAKRVTMDAIRSANRRQPLFDESELSELLIQWWYKEALESVETGWAGALGYWRGLTFDFSARTCLNWGRVWKHKLNTRHA